VCFNKDSSSGLAWRDEHPDRVIDLDGAALNGMILTGINLAGASLRGFDARDESGWRAARA